MPPYHKTHGSNSLCVVNFINIVTVVPLGRSQLLASCAQPLTTTSSILQDFEPVTDSKLKQAIQQGY